MILAWVGLLSESKAINKCSAPRRTNVGKTIPGGSLWSWLREYAKRRLFSNIKHILVCLMHFVYYTNPYLVFDINLQCRKIKYHNNEKVPNFWLLQTAVTWLTSRALLCFIPIESFRLKWRWLHELTEIKERKKKGRKKKKERKLKYNLSVTAERLQRR